jgi:hypothetical protein
VAPTGILRLEFLSGTPLLEQWIIFLRRLIVSYDIDEMQVSLDLDVPGPHDEVWTESGSASHTRRGSHFTGYDLKFCEGRRHT